MRRISLLDCTLRDGGLGLEDASINKLSNLQFRQEDIKDAIVHLQSSGIDIIELGSIQMTNESRKGFAIYPNLETISETMPETHKPDQLFAAFYRGPDTPLADIPNWKPGLCEAVRVSIRYSELQKSLDFCAGLARKGYKVFVQPMLTMRYSDDEIKQIITAANNMDAYALYIVDSYGYMAPEDVDRLFNQYDDELQKQIAIGFHAHNNMNLAFTNAISFLRQRGRRKLIIDSCALGMGQGAGNLQTELITDYLNRNMECEYDYDSVLDLCEIIQGYCGENLWGYSLTRLLPAIHKTAYKYAVSFRHHNGLSFKEINYILSHMPETMAHRYTPDHAEAAVSLLKAKPERMI